MKIITNIKNLRWFINDYLSLRKQLKNNKNFQFGKFYPIFSDKNDVSGNDTGHYYHQDLLVAQRIFLNNPLLHVDIGSRIDGFVAHVASFRQIVVYDIRPNSSNIHKNIVFNNFDVMNILNTQEDSVDSVSSLHVIEHFGLGRYGDKIDIDGHLKGLDSIYKILKKGGKFYFSTPIGPQRIEFNAHRVFSLNYLLELFIPKYNIDYFSFVDDKGDLNNNIILNNNMIDTNCGCKYGCGIFELTKK
jgi:SAM-dependent methyltransferase